MIDSEKYNENPENGPSPIPESDMPLETNPAEAGESNTVNTEFTGQSEPELPASEPFAEPQPAYQQPSYQQSAAQYVHPSSFAPVPPAKPKRTRLIVGLTALFLSVTILLTAVTAIVVYNLANRQNTAATTQAIPQSTTAITSPSTRQPGIQQPSTLPTIQKNPATSSTAGNSATDKHFNISDASTKQVAGKTALSIMQIAKLAKPAVVAISTESRVQNPFGQTGIVDASGSGFIITGNGYVVTNYHVIEGAQTISVALDDGQIFPATIVGSDPNNDVAILKINGTNLPTVTLGKSAELEVGELAVAIGNPLGELSGTVTAGIISALNRKVTIDGLTLTLLQTDAAINSGNSGGALLNSFGEVIGINNAKNAGEGIEGLGFAIPIDTVKPIIESLIRFGYIQGRPKIGIGTRDVTQQMADYYKIPKGVYVSSVEANSAAAIAGIKVGDVIIKADGKETLTTEALNTAKAPHKVGDNMSLTYVREGVETTVQLTLKEDVPSDVKPASFNGQSINII